MTPSLLEKIYNATNDGLDIILSYYPQAQKVVDGKEKHFKIRPENTASASLKKIKGVWRLTDFGGDGEALSPIDIAIRETNLSFNETLYRLAENYNVQNTIDATKNRPLIETRLATEDEPEGHFTYKLNDKLTDEELKLLGPDVKQETCNRYNYYSVESYSKTKDRKTTTITSTDTYPIYLRDCGTFQKIYQPLNSDKAYRFFYNGNKPANYVNGLDELRKAHKKFLSEQIDGEESETDQPRKSKPSRLPEVIICSGERDAINVAAYGYYPIWLNSETARIEEKLIKELNVMVEKIYNIPDIDETGLREANNLALQYIDIYTAELPASLRTYKDHRGKPRKDFRDYIELNPSINTLRDLLRAAKCCKFWEYVTTKTGKSLQINTINLIHFLKVNGFYTYVDKKTQKISYIKVEKYKVTQVIPKQVRGFILNYLEAKNIDQDVQNLFLNSKRSGISVMDDLKEAWFLDFTNCTHNSQTLFFANKAIKIDSDNVHELSRENLRYVWDKHICKHNFTRIEPSFTVTGNDYNFEIKHTQSKIFKYLINGSRLYWRDEIERRATNNDAKNYKYFEENKFNIAGPRLTAKEQSDQIQNLLNKIYAIGYIMHSYKFDSLAMAIWIMEHNLTEDGESSGGSGKSYMIKFLKYIKSVVYLDGRNRKLTDNPHMVEEVNEFTNILWIDDAHQYFDFNSFYGMITSGMTINRKHTSSFALDYKESPKLAVTSNFPPPNNETSTMRRLLLVVFSDWYHKQTSDNDYKQDRRIADDFNGEELHSDLYSEADWNADFNFVVDCMQLYFKMLSANIVIEAPMDNVHKRINIARMGTQFAEWAEVFFSPESENLDTLLLKDEVFKKFVDATNTRTWSTRKFTQALKSFADNTEYIITLNPAKLCRNGERRIIRRVQAQTREMIYLQTNEKINDSF